MPVSETRTDIRPIKVFHDLPKKIIKKISCYTLSKSWLLCKTGDQAAAGWKTWFGHYYSTSSLGFSLKVEALVSRHSKEMIEHRGPM